MLESLNKLPRQFTVGLIFPIIFLNGWLLLRLVKELQPLASILVTATVIAFLLDYPIRFLQQRGLHRSISIGVVLLLFLLLLSVLVLFLGPLILKQANELLTRLPEWIKSGQQQLKSLESWAVAQQLPIDLSSTLNQLVERVTLGLRSLTSQVISLTFSAIGSIVNVALTLVFAIFLVLRGDRLWSGILSWLPVQWGTQIRQSLPQNFERYIAGQVTMAVIIGIAQTATLVILGIPLAELFGFGIGAATLIPFGGTTTIITVSSLLALQNFWLGMKALIAALLVSWGLENILAPRILGEFTGLNPVWMLISLDIGLKVGGILGLVVAVPLASFIKGTFEALRASWEERTIPLITTETLANPESRGQPADVA